MEISGRNTLKGTVTEVNKGESTAHAKIDIVGAIVTASITNAAMDELGLAPGKSAYAVVKASDVMVAIDRDECRLIPSRARPSSEPALATHCVARGRRPERVSAQVEGRWAVPSLGSPRLPSRRRRAYGTTCRKARADLSTDKSAK